MIMLSFILDQYLFPSNRRVDRIDHALRWTIWVASAVLFLTLPDLYEFAMADDASASASASSSPGQDFFHACSGGDVDLVAKSLTEHPHWMTARTAHGETCLHLTGIYGKAGVTALLLQRGADPNVRSTYEKGLRMHPLSWNVYGGHLENIELLLEHGADIDLDFDSMKEDGVSVTSLDVLLELLVNEPGDERFVGIEKVFRKHGAKTMEQTLPGNTEEL
mmetsp:Transcript_2658/g.5753  ORF Transcript_2658/g.5753 Transcript_2658/m.5753 type:complete len:220 (-) Transcript_2658:186-845(-)|eukprot:CAMPEP_0168184618 /NCGR_PEP_ID=MMETSP0139_2-20121125/13344_1 /TAXON_ID=44445 /ORGANISM="Pseudo-nitzschia australis, Strain 10249 10 AB" /LENGTH=219 /DNA_ID=CAMNT_0008106269 /DNA_START=178 /DNA_END=837 /DNA_ORIENTATION=-